MNKPLVKNTYFQYTLCFFLLLPIVFLPFVLEGKSFVWNIDGINQHYPILIYYGKLLGKLLLGKGFAMVDFHIGMGYDTLTTLHYYVIGDPIALFSVFMTMENGVILYNGLILLRMYLIGISFILFCRYHKLSGNGVVLGALIYVFCGYTFFSGVRHPYFLNPMIYLPLLLVGLEQVMRRRKPNLLIVMTFLSAVSNFYFFFILTVIAVVYVIFRYTVTYHKKEEHKLFGLLILGLRTGGYYLWGTLLSAVIFLPVIYAFLQNGRMDQKPEFLVGYLHYNMDYYKNALQGVFSSGVDPGFWLNLCFPTLTAVSFVILFCEKRYRKLAISFALIVLGLCVPVFGYFMNGFAYIANRWGFLLPFAVALIFTATYQKLFRLNRWEKVLLLLGIAGYGVLTFVLYSGGVTKLTFCLLLGTVFLILLLQKNNGKNREVLQQVLTYVILLASLGFNGYSYYAAENNGYVKEFLTKSEVTQLLGGGEAAMITSIKDDSWYRIETFGDRVRNEALTIGFHDVSAYYSLMDASVTDYYKQLELREQRSAFRFDNQDNRTILNALAGVKYMVTTVKRAVPYGYRRVSSLKARDTTYYLYKNKYTLPLGFVYQDYLLSEDYEKLNALEKQNALLSAVVLDEANEYAEECTQDSGIGIEELDYHVVAEDGVILTEDKLSIQEEGAWLSFTFPKRRESEIYLEITGLSIDQKALVMRIIRVEGENEKYKNVNIRSKYYNSYFGKVNFLTNTGYNKEEKSRILVTFPSKAVYSYDDIKIFSVNMKHYRKQVQKLGQNTLKNIKQSNNRLSGDVIMDQKGILLLSVPYSKGWSATVNGKKAELLRGNIMYTALPLKEGEQHIVLSYRTPFLKEGFIISALAFLALLGKLVYDIIDKDGKGGTHG